MCGAFRGRVAFFEVVPRAPDDGARLACGLPRWRSLPRPRRAIALEWRGRFSWKCTRRFKRRFELNVCCACFAAIGHADAECRTLHIVASFASESAGEAGDGLQGLDDSPWSDGARDALRSGRPFIVPAGRSATSAVLPLCDGREVLGTLQIAFDGDEPFSAGALVLLQEAANALAYGIVILRRARQHAAVEQALRRVNRARKTLSAANRALVRATEESALLQAICRIIVEEGGYHFAWVGYAHTRGP